MLDTNAHVLYGKIPTVFEVLFNRILKRPESVLLILVIDSDFPRESCVTDLFLFIFVGSFVG